MNYSHQEYIKVFKAFSDVKRMAIIDLLQIGEHCACVIAEKIDMSQSALSYHMKILVESGIVESQEIGKWIHYRLSKKGIRHAESLLTGLNIISGNTVAEQCNVRR